MKKIISILIILCVAASLFAATGSVRLGAAFGAVIGRTKPFTQGEKDTLVHYKSYGLGFDALFKDDFSDSLAAFFDFNMTIGLEGKFRNHDEAEFKSINDEFKEVEIIAKSLGGRATKKLFSLSAASGLVYKLPFTKTHFNYALGGGIFLDRLFAEICAYMPDGNSEAHRVRCFNLGLSVYMEMSKNISDRFGVSLIFMPRFGVLSFATDAMIKTSADHVVTRDEQRAFGFAPSISMPVSLGAVYYF